MVVIDETREAPTSTMECNLFKDKINSYNLMDIELIGNKYTLRCIVHHGGIRVYKRFDRTLCNDSWRL